jgi:hypothetical protein
MRSHRLLPSLAFAVAGLCVFSFSQQPRCEPLSSIVQKLEQAQSNIQPRSPYQVVREYRLFGSDNSHPSSRVTALVDYRPPNQKTYVIQRHSGSNRGQQVVKRILDHESELAAHNSWSIAAITSRNYNFSYLGEDTALGRRYFLLGLEPKRRVKDLIAGTAWVDQSSFLIRRIEGELAQSPSWWLKKVHVELEFSEISGTWQQTRMEAIADVRFLGSQRLESETLEFTDLLAQAPAKRQRTFHSIPAELLLISPNRHP